MDVQAKPPSLVDQLRMPEDVEFEPPKAHIESPPAELDDVPDISSEEAIIALTQFRAEHGVRQRAPPSAQRGLAR